MWNYVYPSHELYHHGILGQRWGKKNGPPYPIAASSHSASEKKAGWKKSLAGGVSKKGARAYTKELNRTDRLVHQGRSIAKSALLTAGVSLISAFAGTPVMAGVMSRYTVEGRRYKVKPGTSRRGKEYHSNKLTTGSALRRATSYRRSLI